MFGWPANILTELSNWCSLFTHFLSMERISKAEVWWHRPVTRLH